jgi:glyoxylase-like metal-dependent hydrolase (beta-lactamase superfamily II)
MPPEPVDLLFLGNERVIGVYVVETPEGPALFDCGPATCFERLRKAVDLGQIRHLLLSHIHLDHAGAAGHVVAANPQIRVHVAEAGAPHVVDPSRLVASARRLYGDDLDRLYGEPHPVPNENVEVIWDVASGLKSFATTGHASHHASYLLDDGTLLAGDATGVRILPGKHVVPHAPPPEIDLEAWEQTFDDILLHQPEALALIHFGVVNGVEEVAEHVERTRNYLRVWAERVRDGMTEEEFVSAARADLEASEGQGAGAYLRAVQPVVPRARALLAQEEGARCRSCHFPLRPTPCCGGRTLP